MDSNPEPRCGSTETYDGTPCENPASSCPHHDPVNPAVRAAQNAEDIEHLVELLSDITEQVGTIAEELDEQRSEQASIDYEPTDPSGMFQ